MKVLMVDGIQDAAKALAHSLEGAGHEVIPARSEKTAHKIMKKNTFDVVVTDMSMERPYSGLEVLEEARKQNPHVEVIL